MKRGSFVAPRKPMNKISAKVQASRPAFEAEYAKVDARSQGRCEVVLEGRRCIAKAVEHHHVRKPRRTWHVAAWIAHVCRRDHDRAASEYRLGRLLFHELEESGWRCEVSVKASKWA